ncbi:HAAS signaling domain-containing protein [Actinosynnema sp. NPDC053489]|uniref:HAAS signaling domain-containing protein n=1 Tax=Actinosynnema sp. NPDC053489 TaxID=3363916 RepID=UPI0037CAFD68
MNTKANTEVQHYLDGMREALADLPAAEVAEIMDDAGAHVVEVAEEMGEGFSLAALVDRLGTPRAYAEELRVAAGYPSPTAAPPGGTGGGQAALVARFAFWSLVAAVVVAFGFAASRGDLEELTVLVGLCGAAAALLVFRQQGLLGEVAKLPETTALGDALARLRRSDLHRAFSSLRAFQPVWWVVRALLIVAGGVLVHWPTLGLALGLGLAALSLVAGAKARTDRRWLWISLPATGFALGILLLSLGTLVTRFDGYPHSAPVSYNPAPQAPGNIYAFDKDGKPLTDVHLYDEDGRPLDSSWYGCAGEDRHDNRYPRPRVVHDERGCHEEPGVPFTVVMPTVPTTTPSTVTQSPVPTTTPESTTTGPSVPPTTATTTG